MGPVSLGPGMPIRDRCRGRSGEDQGHDLHTIGGNATQLEGTGKAVSPPARLPQNRPPKTQSNVTLRAGKRSDEIMDGHTR